MKYAITGRQTRKMLREADEIVVEFKDRRIIPDYFEDYPNKMIILDWPNALEENGLIKQYAELSDNFCVRVYDLTYWEYFKENGIKFYYGYAVNSFYEVQGLVDLGVEYVKITAPLIFYTKELKKIDTKFRVVPNLAYAHYIPRENGIKGPWIRPEAVPLYEDVIYVLEFEDIDTLEKEQTLFRIYSKDKKWEGNLKYLITNLNVDVDNSLISPELDLGRLNCHQRCMLDGSCHLCNKAIEFEQAIRILRKKIQENAKKKEEN